VPEINGGTVGDLTITDSRWEARLLRTRAFVAARLPAAVPEIYGGTVGDLTITDSRWEARLLRTRAFVAARLSTGRRAGGAPVSPGVFAVQMPVLLRQR